MKKYIVTEQITTVQTDTWEFEAESKEALRKLLYDSRYTENGVKINSYTRETKRGIAIKEARP